MTIIRDIPKLIQQLNLFECLEYCSIGELLNVALVLNHQTPVQDNFDTICKTYCEKFRILPGYALQLREYKTIFEYIQYQHIIKDKLLKNTFNLEGMTVNKRLFSTNLMDDFDFYINRNKKIARYILESIKIDEAFIKKILD